VTRVLEGINILEVAGYAVATSAGAVLADWGATVVKIEPLSGDPIRAIATHGFVPRADGPSLSDVVNRGKRSLAIDLRNPAGIEILYELVARSDVLLTNYLPAVRRKLRMDVPDIRAINPKIIYARASAYGPLGSEAEKGGYDGSTYWQRSGAGTGAMASVSGNLVPLPGPAFGDIQTGMAMAGGIVAALYHRERSGAATVVDTSLMGTGMWAMQAGAFLANVLEVPQLPPSDRNKPTNPLNNAYRTADGRFIAMGMIQNSDAQWRDLCEMLGKPELVHDKRLATREARQRNSADCVQELDAAFVQKDLASWVDVLSRQKWPWTVVQRVGDFPNDLQAKANGYVQTVRHDDGRLSSLVAAPAQFDEQPPRLSAAPEQGANTEEILLELGRSWDDIVRLRDTGVIL
jgi:crotonobetainyl-CoA:carnitine CoA-transferase CaiB-like acyl-CoA transferase